MSRIQEVSARQIFDSLGNPTVEVEVRTSDGVFRASVPSSSSNNPFEAVELRDNGTKYHGKGVMKAVENVKGEIADAIIGMDPTDQEGIDQALIDLDGEERLGRLGANAILAVSMAVCRAGAAKKGIPLYKHINSLAGNPTIVLPVPCFNVVNGGGLAGNKLAMREFMVMPVGADSYSQAMQIGMEVYCELKKVISAQYGSEATAVGDEGGFAPNILDSEEALALIWKAVEVAGYTDYVLVGLDAAASEFYDKKAKQYNLNIKNSKAASTGLFKTQAELLRMYTEFAAKYKVVSIEDPYDLDDWDSFSEMTSKLGEMVQIVGDDLLGSNLDRIQHSLDRNASNALLLKLNQVGTVTGGIEANNLARDAGKGVMVSHRSGDTEDSFIADFAVGLGCGQIKAGAPCRSERLAKYNQLLRIEEELGKRAVYAGEYFRDPWLITPDQRPREPLV